MPRSYETCANCVYWHGCANGRGRCQRFPPQVLMVGTQLIGDWPIVESDDWCGEFKCTTDSPLYYRDLDGPADPATSAAG